MSSLGLEATLASCVTDGIDLTIVTGVLETTLGFDAVSLELRMIIGECFSVLFLVCCRCSILFGIAIRYKIYEDISDIQIDQWQETKKIVYNYKMESKSKRNIMYHKINIILITCPINHGI